ncbi:MAG: hypothetical protein Q7V48_15400 [Deltaproteobacteria bacterium]|nr:hypothetical protein [Deltaproteobacteria bacterium]
MPYGREYDPYDELGITGYGVVEAAECAAPYRNIELSKATVAIQGFGAVGAFSAKFIKEKGAKVVAISSVEGAFYNAKGLEVDKLLSLKEKWGDKAVLKYSQGQQIPLGKKLSGIGLSAETPSSKSVGREMGKKTYNFMDDPHLRGPNRLEDFWLQ